MGRDSVKEWYMNKTKELQYFFFCDEDGICVCVSSSFVLYSFVQFSGFYISSPITCNVKTKTHNGSLIIKTFMKTVPN